MLNEKLYLKIIDSLADDVRQPLGRHDDLLTDKIIEKTIKKFPRAVTQLSIDIMRKNGKKWYDLAVIADIQERIGVSVSWHFPEGSDFFS